MINETISPTPTLSLYEKKINLPSLTPTVTTYQLQKSEFIPTHTPTPIKYIQPSNTPTPAIGVKSKPMLTPTPTPSKQVKGAFIENTEPLSFRLLSILSWLLVLKMIGL